MNTNTDDYDDGYDDYELVQITEYPHRGDPIVWRVMPRYKFKSIVAEDEEYTIEGWDATDEDLDDFDFLLKILETDNQEVTVEVVDY